MANKNPRLLNAIKILVLTVIFIFDFVQPAFAYIDPSIGALLIQGLLGGIAGVALFWRRIRERIAKFIGLSQNKEESDVNEDSNNEAEDS